VLLLVCALQVAWWAYEGISYTESITARRLEHLERDASAARLLLEQGVDPDVLRAAYPQLQIGARAGTVTVDPGVVRQITESRRQRLNRFVWEGVFFLVVIVAGMAVLVRALRHDVQLRRRQQNFLAAVSHEFKSPLASARLAAETLELRDPGEQSRRTLVGRILGGLDRLDVMVTNILQTTRLEEGHVRIEKRSIPLAPLLEDAVAEMESFARDSGVSIVTRVEPRLGVRADLEALRSVLGNLLSNAIKATGGREKASVRVEAESVGEQVVIRVTDDGRGFEPAEGSRLFDKFYRVGSELRRTSEGSGLGLYIVGRLVELHGGKVLAESDGPGRGATFTVLLPGASRHSA
jgi:signal transduction histidine kinase